MTSGDSDRLVGRADRARDEPRAAVLPLELVGYPARHPRGFQIDLADQVFCGVVRLADPVGGEGIGLGDVRPRREIGAVDGLRHLRLGQREDVFVALLVLGQPERPGIVGLRQLPVLDLGAERAVGDQDALGRFGEELFAPGALVGFHAAFSSAGPDCFGRIPSIWQMA